MATLSRIELERRREMWVRHHDVEPDMNLLNDVPKEKIPDYNLKTVSGWIQTSAPMPPSMLERVMDNYEQYREKGLVGELPL